MLCINSNVSVFKYVQNKLGQVYLYCDVREHVLHSTYYMYSVPI